MGVVIGYLPYLMDIDNELNKSEDFFRIFDSEAGISNTTGEEVDLE